MSAHTPGPWKVRAGSFADDGVPSYEVVMNGEPTVNASDANLINAAPDLLAAAIAVRESCPCDNDITKDFNAAWHQMLAAIAKAEGGH